MGHTSAGILTRGDALSSGYSDRDLQRLVDIRQYGRIRRGVYRRGSPPSRHEEQHRLLIHGAAQQISDDSAFSHQSGAVLHGVPLWNVPHQLVHVSRPEFPRSRRSRTLYTHPSGPAYDTVQIDGLPVVPAARTVMDLARTLPFEEGVVAMDGALAQQIVTPEELAYELRVARKRPGARRAAGVLAFADGRSESVGESRSRVRLHRLGMTIPALQVSVRDEHGAEVARCDFGDEKLKIAGEFDGFVKYGRLLKPGERPGDAVFREKRREDVVRDCGWEMVRWVWDELDHPEIIAGRWHRAVARARARR